MFSGRGYAWTFHFPDVDKDTSLPSNDSSVATGSLELVSHTVSHSSPVRWLRTHAPDDSWSGMAARVIWCTPANIAVLEVPTSQRGIQNFAPDSTGVTQTKSGPARGSNNCKGVMDCVRVQQGDVWRGFPSCVVAVALALRGLRREVAQYRTTGQELQDSLEVPASQPPQADNVALEELEGLISMPLLVKDRAAQKLENANVALFGR